MVDVLVTNASIGECNRFLNRANGDLWEGTSRRTSRALQYDVSKFGALSLTNTLALEFGQEGVRINPSRLGGRHPDIRGVRTGDARPDRRTQSARTIRPFEGDRDAVLFLSMVSDCINGHELRTDGRQQPIDSWKHRVELT